MKRRKLVGTLLMTAMLVFGSVAGVMASEGGNEAEVPDTDIKITKVYSLLNEGTTAPDATFTFHVEAVGCSNKEADIPILEYGNNPVSENRVDISFDEISQTKEMSLALTFPVDESTRVGEYVYKITEEAGTVAGIEYSEKVIHAKVTVLNNEATGEPYVASVTYTVEGDKLGDGEGFENQYQAGNLTVQKNVTGNLGDTSKYFDVKVTLISEDGVTYNEKFSVSGGSYSDNPTEIELDKETTFKLKSTDTITIKNLPYGVTYTVVEADYTGADGYDKAEYTVNDTDQGTTSVSKEAVDAATEAVVITNNKDTAIDTGVILDNIPYIILIVVVAAAVVFMVLRKRANADLD